MYSFVLLLGEACSEAESVLVAHKKRRCAFRHTFLFLLICNEAAQTVWHPWLVTVCSCKLF